MAMFSIALISCNQNPNSDKTLTDSQTIDRYGINVDSVKVHWTAFKTTKRIGVSGTFDSISVKCENNSGTIEDILKSANIHINTAFVNSNNAIRDPKIVKFFFGNFTFPNEIVASVDSLIDNKVSINLKMNGMEKSVLANYVIENNVLNIYTTLMIPDWNAEASLNALNKECEDLHKDEDGISKLWPEVEVKITCPLVSQE